jgi:hypothetical protein
MTTRARAAGIPIGGGGFGGSLPPTPTPTPTPPPTGNAALITSMLQRNASANTVPIFGWGPGSREEWMYQKGTTGLGRTSSAGFIPVAQAIGRKFRQIAYPSTSPSYIPYPTASLRGSSFAASGNGLALVYQQLREIAGSRLDMFWLAMSTNDIDPQAYDKYRRPFAVLSPSNFFAAYEEVAVALIGLGMPVGIIGMYERGTRAANVPAPWQAGATQRLMIPSIVDYAKTRCAALGIPYFDPRGVMIDPSTGSLNNPFLAFMDPDDDTHSTTKGADAEGLDFDASTALATAINSGATLPQDGTGNMLAGTVFNMAGTGGTVNTGITGQLADGFTATRSNTSSGATIALSKIAGGRPQRITIDPTGMANTTIFDSITISIPLSGATIGLEYEAEADFAVSANDAMKGYPEAGFNFGGNSNRALVPVKNGNSTGADATGYPGPTRAYTIAPIVPAKAASATTGSLQLIVYFTKGAAPFTVDIGKPIVRPFSWVTVNGTITKAAEISYRADTTGVVAAVQSVSGNAVFDNTAKTVTITGNNGANTSAQILFNQPGRIVFSGGASSAYSNPRGYVADADSFGNVIVATEGSATTTITETITFYPLNPNNAQQTYTVTTNNAQLPAGTTYAFTGTNGTTIAALYPTFIEDGTSGTLTVNSNACQNSTTSPIGGVKAPSEVAAGQPSEMRWTTTSGTSVAPTPSLLYVDRDNRLFFVFNSGNLQLRSRVGGGSDTVVQTFSANYKTPSASDYIIAQLVNDQGDGKWYVKTYLRRVPYAESLIDVNSIVASLGTARNTGIANHLSGGTNRIDNFNPRPLSTFTPRVGLKALTITTNTGTAGVRGTTAINGKADTTSVAVTATLLGSPVNYFSTDFGDTQLVWSADAVAGVYTVSYGLTDPLAENNGFAGTWTVTLS